MMLDRPRKFRNFEIDRVPGNFWATPDGIKVSTSTFHAVLCLTRTAEGLWSLYGARGILLRKKPLF